MMQTKFSQRLLFFTLLTQTTLSSNTPAINLFGLLNFKIFPETLSFIPEKIQNMMDSFQSRIKASRSMINELIEQQKEKKLEKLIINFKIKQPTLEEVKKNAYYAAVDSCNDEQVLTWSCKACKEITKPDRIYLVHGKYTKTRGYVGIIDNENIIYVSFRGTQYIQNWIEDISFVQIRYKDVEIPNAKVHIGFYSALNELSIELIPLLENILEENQYRTFTFKFAGHSLGGALSTLAAIRIKEHFDLDWNQVELFTYGQPRVGNDEFIRWLDMQPFKVSRAVNYYDLVPRLPPIRGFGLHHYSNEVFIYPNNTAVFCSNEYMEDPDCALSVDILKLRGTAHLVYFDVDFTDTAC